MRNRITLIILLIAIILLCVAVFRGIKIGQFEILSVYQIQEKNNNLNNKIQKASTLTSINYPDNVETLEETFERYKLQKQKYEELSSFNDNKEVKKYETKQYDIGYLWKVLGKYARSRNLTLSLDVQRNNSGENLYDFNFSVSGEYVNISQFIADIENDSDLYFRIYNFKMSGSGTIISSTFSVKAVNIDPATITNTQTSRVQF